MVSVRDGERAGAGVQRLRDTPFGAIKAAPHGAHALRASKGGVEAQLPVGAGAVVGKACGAGHGQQFAVLHRAHIWPFGFTEGHVDQSGASGRGFYTPRYGQGVVFDVQALHPQACCDPISGRLPAVVQQRMAGPGLQATRWQLDRQGVQRQGVGLARHPLKATRHCPRAAQAGKPAGRRAQQPGQLRHALVLGRRPMA